MLYFVVKPFVGLKCTKLNCFVFHKMLFIFVFEHFHVCLLRIIISYFVVQNNILIFAATSYDSRRLIIDKLTKSYYIQPKERRQPQGVVVNG